MQRTVYISDISGAPIEGSRFVVDVKQVDEDGSLNREFGIRRLDASDTDTVVKVAIERGNRLNFKGKAPKEED